MTHHLTLAMVSLLTGASVFAQGPDPRYEAELSYSLSYRAAMTHQVGLNSTYSGLELSYLRAGGAYFLAGRPFGARAEGNFETFTVSGHGLDGDASYTKRMTSYFAFGGVAAELSPLPWLRLEGDAGWGVAGLPAIVYSESAPGQFAAMMLNQTGPVLAGRADVAISPTLVSELRLRTMPVSLGSKFDGSAVWARELSVGISFGTTAMRLGGLRIVALADYELSLRGGNVASNDFYASQVANRLGVTIRATGWPERSGLLDPRTGPGRIHGRVLSKDSGKPIASAQVQLPGRRTVTTDADGRFRVEKIGPGTVVVEVSASGYRVTRDEITVPPGGEISESLKLVRRTGPGKLRGTVRALLDSGEAGAPLEGVEVKVQGGPAVRSGADGTFTLEGIGPGPVSLSLTAKGYKPGEELVQVLPESESEVSLSLAKASAAPATFRGQVRSAKGGTVPALLRIPEAQVSTRAGADGRFAVRLPGGRYTVVFSAQGYVPQTKVVEVADGDQALYYVDLSPSEP